MTVATIISGVPTTGAMMSELERLGVPVRGHGYSDEQLCAMLRERGYDVHASAAASKKRGADVDDNDR